MRTVFQVETDSPLGLGSNTSQDIRRAAQVGGLEGIDADGDGLSDLFDNDSDNDGILNNYEEDFEPLIGSYYLFAYIKSGLTQTVNVNALGRDLTRTEVDQLVNRTKLAVEVKGGSVQTSELNCGSLSYCTAGRNWS